MTLIVFKPVTLLTHWSYYWVRTTPVFCGIIGVATQWQWRPGVTLLLTRQGRRHYYYCCWASYWLYWWLVNYLKSDGLLLLTAVTIMGISPLAWWLLFNWLCVVGGQDERVVACCVVLIMPNGWATKKWRRRNPDYPEKAFPTWRPSIGSERR